MGKLTNLRPSIQTPPSRLAILRDEHGHAKQAEPWRGWYSLARWKRLRLEVFERDGYMCQCGCGVLEGRSSQLVADHIKPHRGDPALFWDDRNLQTLTKTCHDSAKQAEERRGFIAF